MKRGRILVIDDEDIVLTSCRRILEPEGYFVELAKSGSEALCILSRTGFDLVLTDLKMPDMDGIEVLLGIREQWAELEVIIMTGYGTVSTAVDAMKKGAFDYIEKPFQPDDLMSLVSRALESKKLVLENLSLREELFTHYELTNIVGVSQAMQKVFHLISKVANASSTVLITGESGTGKELVARAIHFNSPRREQPFVVVDCLTIPDTLIESELFGHAKGAFTGAAEKKKGLLESANKGTIFLDEIGNLDISTQAKLLRVLQEREFRSLGEKKPTHVDIRFISATNKNLLDMTKEGTFREDFFYRLNIFPIHIPPLRERKEDIPHVAYHFLQKYSEELGKNVTHITAEAMRSLIAFDWPGNVRHLENIMQRALIMCQGKTLRPEHFSSFLEASAEGVPMTVHELKETKKKLRHKSVEKVEIAFLVEALKRNHWNISKAASDVKMQRTNFHALLKKYNITKKVVGIAYE
jgi:DNA-binding NtrC family response regulator